MNEEVTNNKEDKLEQLCDIIVNIEKKVNSICDKYGKFEYEIIEHPVSDNYKSLDIISKRLVLERLKDTIVITSDRFLDKTYLFSQYFNTDSILKKLDNKPVALYRDKFSNEILNSQAIWLKIKDKNGNCLKFEEVYKCLDYYVQNKLFIYAVKSKLKLPYVDLSNIHNTENNLKEIMLHFNLSELRLLGYNGYIDALVTPTN